MRSKSEDIGQAQSEYENFNPAADTIDKLIIDKIKGKNTDTVEEMPKHLQKRLSLADPSLFANLRLS